jgi:outer membrane protein assembly factor BamB
MKLTKIVLVLAALVAAQASSTGAGKGVTEWAMWGGSPDRNMVSDATGLPSEWDIKTGKNIKWVASLGSQSYGNPVVANGVVLLGTNNEGVRDPDQAGDRGVLMAFRESDGEFLWQATFEKLLSGRANDWPYQGVASSPLIIGEIAYFVSNRGVVNAVDIRGFQDGENDGVITNETLTGPHDADFLWQFDMMEEVGAFPHNMSNSSPVAWENLLYICTSNGQDESHVHIPSPRAPAIIALDINTGKLVWEDASPGDRILHGQWSTPAVGMIGGVMQVVHGQGDAFVRGYNARTGEKLWEFDTNPKDSVWPKNRNEVIATPVIFDNKVFIANGQDPEHGEGVGHLYAIDATKRGDITETGRIWQFDDIRRSISTAAIKDGLIYYPDFSGFFHCLDVNTGKEVWVHDMFAAMWSSPLVADGKVYLGDEDGDVVVMQAGREKKVINEMNMAGSVYSTVVTANGVMYIMTRNELYAIQEGAQLAR